MTCYFNKRTHFRTDWARWCLVMSNDDQNGTSCFVIVTCESTFFLQNKVFAVSYVWLTSFTGVCAVESVHINGYCSPNSKLNSSVTLKHTLGLSFDATYATKVHDTWCIRWLVCRSCQSLFAGFYQALWIYNFWLNKNTFIFYASKIKIFLCLISCF